MMSSYSSIVYLGVILLLVVFMLKAMLKVKRRPSAIESNLAYPEKRPIWSTHFIEQAIEIVETDLVWFRGVGATQLNLFVEALSKQASLASGDEVSEEFIKTYRQKEQQVELVLWLFYSGKFIKKYNSPADAVYWLDLAVEKNRPYAHFYKALARIKQAIQKNEWSEISKIDSELETSRQTNIAEAFFISVVFDCSKRQSTLSTTEIDDLLGQAVELGFLPARYLSVRIDLQHKAQNTQELLAELAGLSKNYHTESKLYLCLNANNTTDSARIMQQENQAEELLAANNIPCIESIANNLIKCNISEKLLMDKYEIGLLFGSIEVLPALFQLQLGQAEFNESRITSLEKSVNNKAFASNPSKELARMLFLVGLSYLKEKKADNAKIIETMLIDFVNGTQQVGGDFLESLATETELNDESLTVLRCSFEFYDLGFLVDSSVEQLKQLVIRNNDLAAVQLVLSNVISIEIFKANEAIAKSNGLLAYEYSSLLRAAGEIKQAWDWMQLASELNNDQATFHAGLLYLGNYSFDLHDVDFTDCVERNVEIGEKKLKSAATMGSPLALASLSRHYIMMQKKQCFLLLREASKNRLNDMRVEFELANGICQHLEHRE